MFFTKEPDRGSSPAPGEFFWRKQKEAKNRHFSILPLNIWLNTPAKTIQKTFLIGLICNWVNWKSSWNDHSLKGREKLREAFCKSSYFGVFFLYLARKINTFSLESNPNIFLSILLLQLNWGHSNPNILRIWGRIGEENQFLHQKIDWRLLYEQTQLTNFASKFSWPTIFWSSLLKTIVKQIRVYERKSEKLQNKSCSLR